MVYYPNSMVNDLLKLICTDDGLSWVRRGVIFKHAKIVRVIPQMFFADKISREKSGNTRFYPTSNDRVLLDFFPKIYGALGVRRGCALQWTAVR